jgi:hypothetical protein
VVELQNDQIALPAVDAGVILQKLHQEADSFVENATPPGGSVVDVALLVVPVVLPLVHRPTRSAVIIELAFRFASPGELG